MKKIEEYYKQHEILIHTYLIPMFLMGMIMVYCIDNHPWWHIATLVVLSILHTEHGDSLNN